MGEIAFRILGPLQLAGIAARDVVSPVKPRQLLATLLLHPNRYVSTDLITDVLWETAPPRSAAANLRTYVRMLRECIDRLRLPASIDTHATGYQLVVNPDELDATRAEAMVTEAGHLLRSGDRRRALALLDAACRLWRGTALEDLPLRSSWQTSLIRLDQQRAQLVEQVVPLHIEVGDADRAARLARDALDRAPYSDEIWYLLVRSLVASGRAGAARQAVEEHRRLLADELDVPPGPRMTEAAELVDGEAPTIRDAPAVPLEPARPVGRRVPRQLPPDIPDFTGRRRELTVLLDAVSARPADRPPVIVLSGPPGAGKSVLAVHTAHQAHERFPDGQVYVDMRAGSQPRDAGEAVAEILVGLGINSATIPDDADRRSAMLRSELADRRTLVLLDDAASVRQVTPLLPGTGASALLVTSRRSLTGLVGAVHVDIDVMDLDDARAMLAGVLGEHRAADTDATDRIVHACGRLPLALRVAAGRMRHRPDLDLRALARRLHDSATVLDELAGDTGGVRVSAELSYRVLSPDQARAYRLFGLLGTDECPTWALHALVGPALADRVIDGLIDAHLVRLFTAGDEGAPRRAILRMHDLLRAHAGEHAATASDARADLRLVVSEWIARTQRATDALGYRHFGVPAPDRRDATSSGETFDSGWLDAERDGVLPVLSAAVGYGLVDEAWQLAASWSPYFDLRGDYLRWEAVHSTVLPALTAPGHEVGRAVLLRDLGQSALYRDELDLAEQRFAVSAELFDRSHHSVGIGVVAVGQGTLCRIRNDAEAALAHYRRALDAFLASGDRAGEAVARNAIAYVWLNRGEHAQAESWLTSSFELAVAEHDQHREAQVRRRFAVLRRQQGDIVAAQRELDRALRIFESLRDQHCASYARHALGELYLLRDDLAGARRLFIAALDAGRALGDLTAQAEALTGLGEVSLRADRQLAARRYLTQAVRSWQLASNTAAADRVAERLGGIPAEDELTPAAG